MWGSSAPVKILSHPTTAAGRWLPSASIASGAAVALAGAGYLSAWLAGFMTERGLSAITIKTNTSLCLLLLGTALVLLTPATLSRSRRAIGQVLAAAASLVALLTLSEHVVGWDLGIDLLLAREPAGALAVSSPNRMGPPASLGFSVVGLALLVLSRGNRRCARPVQWMALGVSLLALVGIVGYLYGVEVFYGVSHYTGVALPTAASLMMLSLGLLIARPDEGLMARVTANDAGGRSIRRILPLFLVLPMVLGWLRLIGEQRHLYSTAEGTGLLVLAFIISFTVLVYRAGKGISASESAMIEQREWLRVTLASIGDGVLATDTAGRIIFFNRVAAAVTGWTEEEALGQPVQQVFTMVDEQTRIPTADIIDRVLREDSAVSLSNYACLVRHDGGTVPIEERAAPIKDAAGRVTGVVRVFHDVSKRRQSEAELRRSLRRFELLSQTAGKLLQEPEPQKVVDSLCHNVMEHLDCQVFFNFLADEAAGKLHLNACAGIPPEEAKRMEWLDYGVAVCGCAARDRARIVAERIPSTPDVRTERVKSYGVRAYACHPLLGPAGRLIGTLSFGTRSRETFEEDELSLMKTVTDLVAVAMARMRSEEDLRHTVEELSRSNRELEQFAYVTSHDLQEPLRQVRSYLGILRDRFGDTLDGKAAQYMQFVYDGAAHMRSLVQDLLSYSRVGAGGRKRDRVSCDEALAGALANLEENIGVLNGSVSHEELPVVLGDRSQFVQLFQNLIGNAVKFHRDGVPPEVHVGCRRSGNGWLLWVKDNGIGIDPEYHEKVFVIFQRLHSRSSYPGTGIGLAICRKIVEQHGGKIWIESNAGKGATVYFTLPEAAAA